MITQKYLLDVLDRTDELEKRGHLQAGYSKDFSKQIIKLVEIVPPFELKSSMTNLENEIKQKLTEMESKIKNLKAKKKKKAVKKTFEQRMAQLSDELKKAMNEGLSSRDLKEFKGAESYCCPGSEYTEAMSFWPPLFEDEKTKE